MKTEEKKPRGEHLHDKLKRVRSSAYYKEASAQEKAYREGWMEEHYPDGYSQHDVMISAAIRVEDFKKAFPEQEKVLDDYHRLEHGEYSAPKWLLAYKTPKMLKEENERNNKASQAKI